MPLVRGLWPGFGSAPPLSHIELIFRCKVPLRNPYASAIRKSSIYKYTFICIFITGFFQIVQRYPWTARVCVDWVHFPIYALLPIGRRISSAPPCCSPGTHPLGLLPRRVSGELRGGAAEILRRIGRRAWENEPNLHILGWD